MYYLLKPYTIQSDKTIDNSLLKYTLIDLKERFTLRNELMKYIHAWLSYAVFPNTHINVQH